MLNHLRRYWKEVRFALRVGATLQDGLKLAAATLAFHARCGKGRVAEARIRLGDLLADVRLRVEGGDFFVFYEVLMDGVYDIPADRLPTPPQYILDLGANIGMTALVLGARHPAARLVCVEPDPVNAALLRHNVACLGARCTVVEAAVSGEPGRLRLSTPREHYNISLARGDASGPEVRVMTVDQVLAECSLPHADLVKMDVEGAERWILPARPAWLRQVRVFLAELHEGYGFAEFERDTASSGLVMEKSGVATLLAWRAEQA